MISSAQVDSFFTSSPSGVPKLSNQYNLSIETVFNKKSSYNYARVGIELDIDGYQAIIRSILTGCVR